MDTPAHDNMALVLVILRPVMFKNRNGGGSIMTLKIAYTKVWFCGNKSYSVVFVTMLSDNSFPYEIRDVEENEMQEYNKYFKGAGYSNVQVGPKNYKLISDYRKDAANIYNMPLRNDDIFVASYPRSGTTWTQELVWLLASNLDYSTAEINSLQSRYVFLEFSMFMKKEVQEQLKESNVGNQEDIKLIDTISTLGSELAAQTPSPRFFKTHLPMSLLPPIVLDSAKVVYVARDPRDVAVSYYHLNRMYRVVNYTGNFKTYWSLFMKNIVYWSPFFEHLKEAWQLRHHPNMLFLFYEELSKDLPASVRLVAEFLEKPLTPDQMTKLCTHLSFENFKNNSSVNHDDLRRLGMLAPNEVFVRKGKSGGWQEYFDDDMKREADIWIAKNLENTDIRFPSMQ